MKRAAVDHPKLQRLQRRLSLTRFQAMGLMEALWHFTGRYALEGDVGRWADEEIAAWVEWQGDATELIEALVVCGWLDRDPKYRLLIHDWADHADEATKIALKRAGKTFVVPTESEQVATPQPVEEQSLDSVATVSAPPEPKPCHAMPEPETKDPPNPPDGGKRRQAPPSENDQLWAEFVAIYPPRSGDRGLAKGRERLDRLLTKPPKVTAEELLAGVRAYRAWADATETTGTKFVKQIPTWLGEACWREVYAIPSEGRNGKPNGRSPGPSTAGGAGGSGGENRHDRLAQEAEREVAAKLAARYGPADGAGTHPPPADALPDDWL